MELIFLNRSDLSFKDHATISSEFNIIIDLVVPQKSSFILNKVGLNVSIGDVVFLKDKNVTYLGIVETTELNGDYQTKIETTEFRSIFDICVLVKSFQGDICEFLKEIIIRTFKNNSDPLQNLPYLLVDKSASEHGSLVFGEDELVAINDIAQTLAKTYGVKFIFDIIISNGVINGIKVDICKATSKKVFKSNLAAISNLSITDSNVQAINKITFIPKEENISYKTVIEYYLLSDGTVSTDKHHQLRYPYVKGISQFYSDNENDSLLTKAQTELLKGNLEHNISFNLYLTNQIIRPFKELYLGEGVEFVTNSKKYETMITQIAFKNTFHECSIVLGECRVRLTEKLKLLERKT